MRHILYIIATLVLLTQVSCKKFLDTHNTDTVSPDNYYTTEAQLNLALTGVYDVLGAQNLYAERMAYRYGMEGDEGYYSATNPVSGPCQYNYTSADAEILALWTVLYQGIARANILLKNVDNNQALDVAIRGRVKGEALFIRSYLYFLLVQNWGGVPLILEPVPATKTNIPRATAKQVYDQIIGDMTEAEGLVNSIKTNGFGGRVSKSAVRGVLARVCLAMAGQPVNETSKYQDAKDWAKKVIDDADAAHALNSTFQQPFINYAQDKYDIKESIWEVEFRGTGADTYQETARFAWLAGQYCLNVATGQGNGFIKPTAKYYQLFTPGDLRREWTNPSFTYDPAGAVGARTYIATPTAPAAMYNLFMAKYRREYETATPKHASVSPMNYPLLRFSDVLLMYAEAENELNGPTMEAINAVNLVRRRAWASGIKDVTITAGGSGYTSAPAVTFSGGGGSGAVATAVVSNGQVIGLTFPGDSVLGKKIGSGYTSEPTITLTGGGGTGATATATIYSKSEGELTAAQTASKDDFRLMIQDERSRELSFEALRRGDLLRWGIFTTSMQAVGNQLSVHIPGAFFGVFFRSVTTKHEQLPIPAAEMSLNNALTQNPGW